MTRNDIALALSAQMPLSEIESWDDRTKATTWDLLKEQEKAMKAGA